MPCIEYMPIEGSKINTLPSLEDLEIQIPELATLKKTKIKKIENHKIIFNKVSFDLKITTESSLEDYWLCSITIEALDTQGEEFALASLSVGENREANEDGNFEAATYVHNNNRLVSGLGRVLYEKLFKLLPRVSIGWNIPILHIIEKTPSHGLDSEKWDELMLPILKQYKYIKRKSTGYPIEIWERIFLPN